MPSFGGVNMRFRVDRLPNGHRFPCSVRELKQLIKCLPPDDVRGIQSVRLSTHKSRDDGVYLSDGRVELRWAIDSRGRHQIGRRPPSAATLGEWSRFGGTCVVESGIHYAFWADQKQLRRYVQFVLLHEIGHHVFARRGQRSYTKQQEEEFADNYAEQYLPAEITPNQRLHRQATPASR